MNRQRIFTWGIFIAVVAILVGLDLWLKSWAATNLMGQDNRVLIPSLLGLTYTRNTGAAFGLLGGFDWSRWVLAILKILLMAGLLWFYNRLPQKRRTWLFRVPLILIFAGGVGNLVDRLVLGYVRDMLEFLFVNFPIFNLADVFVVVGCILGVVVMLVEDYP